MMRGSAVFSDDGRYRYKLVREWGDGDRLAWLMLNPSKADGERDDPTVRRTIGFSQRWGYGSLVIVNLFPMIATDPADLTDLWDPQVVGINRHRIASEVRDRDLLVACGNGAEPWRVWAHFEIGAAQRTARALYSLGETKMGWPPHPLRLPYSTERRRWP